MRSLVNSATLTVFAVSAQAAFAQESEYYPENDPTAEAGAQSASVETRFLGDSVGEAVTLRFSGPTDLVTQDSEAEGSPLTYWTGAEARVVSGDSDGWQAEGIFGVDYFVGSQSLVGGFVGLGKSDRDILGSRTQVSAQVLGGYYAQALEGGTLVHVFLGGGNAEFESDGASFDAPRKMAGFSISGETKREKTVFVPSIRAMAVRDEMPAFTGDSGAHPAANVDGLTVSATARWESVEPFGDGDLLPYVSVGVDYLYTDLDNGMTDKAIAPRVGVGLFGQVGDGLFALDLDAGKVDSGSFDLGARATYSFGF